MPPALASSIVRRPRLEERLEQATARRLTVIVAGAGAGKSTLLAAWAVRRGAAWYTLTEADRDLMQLGLGMPLGLVPGTASVAWTFHLIGRECP